MKDAIALSKQIKLSPNSPVVNAGSALRSAYDQRMSAVKKEASVTTPNLVEYLDFNSGDRNSTVTKGSLGQISGHRLKFDPEDANQGIFFIDSQGQETKVTVVGENKPARLMFMIPPNLSTGDATLSVRTAIGQDIRSGSLSATLSVTA